MSASRPRLSIVFVFVLLCAVALLAPASHGDPSAAATRTKQSKKQKHAAGKRLRAPKFEVLSSRADLVSGGDALVALYLPRGAKASQVRFTLGRTGKRKVTGAFAIRASGRMEGLVTGLGNGPNLLTARIGKQPGVQIRIVNHPNGGPVLSGPQIQPWVCQGSAVDKQCNQPGEVQLPLQVDGPERGRASAL